MIIEITTKCSECMHNSLCKYANRDGKMDIESGNSFLVLSCSKFRKEKARAEKVRTLAPRIVQEWRKNNPYGNKTACAKGTGLSRPTVIKYWEVVESEEANEQ